MRLSRETSHPSQNIPVADCQIEKLFYDFFFIFLSFLVNITTYIRKRKRMSDRQKMFNSIKYIFFFKNQNEYFIKRERERKLVIFFFLIRVCVCSQLKVELY